MRLLYFFGRINKFDGGVTDYVSVNYSREYEFMHNGRAFMCGEEKELKLTIQCSGKFLPCNFWSEQGKVYNCTIFVGENGSGKSTLLQDTIANMFRIKKGMISGEMLMVFQNSGEIHAIACINNEYYYSKTGTIYRFKNSSTTLVMTKTKNQNSLIIPNSLETTGIAFFSNAFSGNDMLDNVNIFSDRMRYHEREQGKLYLWNYSLTNRVTNFSGHSIDQFANEHINHYWNTRYTNEARFVLSDKAISIANRFENRTDFKIPLPNKVRISCIKSVIYSLTQREISNTNNSMKQLLCYAYGDKRNFITAKNYSLLENGPTFFLAVYALYQFVSFLSYDGERKDFNNKVLSIVQHHKDKSVKRPSVNVQIKLLEEIKELLDETFDIYNSNFYKNVKLSLNETYDFGMFLYKSRIITKFKTKRFDYNGGQYGKIMDLEADIVDLKDTSDDFTEFIDRYNATIECSERPYLSFNWGLSSGEDNMLDMLSSLYKQSIDNNDCIQTLQVYLDEADIGYHPEWQRKWFYIFPQMIEEIFKETTVNDIQLFLTSHSPLLLGDIPSRCAKYVESDKNGSFIIKERLYDEDGEVETFGQNLYTILRNGFFLKEGAIGEIAIHKSKEIADAFSLFRQLKRDIESEEVDDESILNEINSIESKNKEALEVLNLDFIEFDESNSTKTIITKSGECIEINCGAYLYYIDTLINLYSDFIKEHLKKELLDIILFISKDERESAINAINEQIKRLEEYKNRLEYKDDKDRRV